MAWVAPVADRDLLPPLRRLSLLQGLVPAVALRRGERTPRRPPKRDGKCVCRFCDKIITAPRRSSYCDATCADNFAVRYFPAVARGMVWGRDHGVCAACEMDVGAVERFMQEIEYALGCGSPQYRSRLEGWGLPHGGWLGSHLLHLWEADHIVPYSEGGDTLGLENLRTLCIWCHRERTRTWHGERARERKQAKAAARRAARAGEAAGVGA